MDYSKLTPQELIRICANTDDAEPWDALINMFTPVVSITIRRVLQPGGMYTPEVHEELVQGFFLKVWGKPGDHAFLKQMDTGPESHPFAYFQKAARHYALDYVKAQRAKRRGAGQSMENVDEVHAAMPARSFGSASNMEWQVLVGEITNCFRLAGLNDLQIAIFWLYYGPAGLTADQISKLSWVKLSVKGVESLLHRMIRDLRACLEGKGKDPPPSS